MQCTAAPAVRVVAAASASRVVGAPALRFSVLQCADALPPLYALLPGRGEVTRKLV